MKTLQQCFLFIPLMACFFSSSSLSWAKVQSPTQEIRTPHFHFWFHPSDRVTVEKIMDQSGKLFDKITQDIGFYPKTPIGVIVATTDEEFNQLQPPNRPLPSWAVGVAYPSQNTMIIRSPRIIQGNLRDTLKTFTHELSHLVLASGFRGRPIPRWLNEGLAMYESYEWRPSQDFMMGRWVLSGTLIPLDQMTKAFGGNQFRAQQAYFQSYSLIHYLISTHGFPKFHHLVRQLSKGIPFDQAIQEALGMTPQAFEKKWKRYLAFRFNWVPLLTSTGVLWGLISAALFGAYMIRKRRNQRIIQEWEREEQMEETIELDSRFSGNDKMGNGNDGRG